MRTHFCCIFDAFLHTSVICRLVMQENDIRVPAAHLWGEFSPVYWNSTVSSSTLVSAVILVILGFMAYQFVVLFFFFFFFPLFSQGFSSNVDASCFRKSFLSPLPPATLWLQLCSFLSSKIVSHSSLFEFIILEQMRAKIKTRMKVIRKEAADPVLAKHVSWKDDVFTYCYIVRLWLYLKE